MNKVVEMIFGSHLYGTNSAASDTDIKGVYMPTARQMKLGKFPNAVDLSTKTDQSQKNTAAAADTDMEFYSLHYFMDLACEGETVALDMLHAPLSACRVVTKEWAFLAQSRSLFYTKNIKSLEALIREYGDRARQAEANECIDWKAVSHAFRAAFQMRAIFADGGFTYPLPEAEYLKTIKSGQLNFKNDVAPALDVLMDKIEALSKASTYPERVDSEKVDFLLLTLVNTEF